MVKFIISDPQVGMLPEPADFSGVWKMNFGYVAEFTQTGNAVIGTFYNSGNPNVRGRTHGTVDGKKLVGYWGFMVPLEKVPASIKPEESAGSYELIISDDGALLTGIVVDGGNKLSWSGTRDVTQEPASITIDEISEYFAPGHSDKLTAKYSVLHAGTSFDLKISVLTSGGQTVYEQTKPAQESSSAHVFEWDGLDKGKPVALPHLSPFTLRMSAKQASAEAEFKVEISSIAIDTPEISKPRSNEKGTYRPYELPADDYFDSSAPDTSPLTAVNIEVKVRSSSGGELPAPDGTRVYLGRQTSASSDELVGGGIFLSTPSKSELSENNNMVATVQGKASALFLGSRTAEGWQVDHENYVEPKVVKIEPHTFVLTASAQQNGEPLAYTNRITIVEGRPSNFVFLTPKRRKRWHDSFSKDIGDIIGKTKTEIPVANNEGTIEEVSPVKKEIRVGAIWPVEVVPTGSATLFAVIVTDMFSNPVEMDMSSDGKRGDYRLLGKATLGWSAFTTPGYFLSEKHANTEVGADSTFRFPIKAGYPKDRKSVV